MSKSIDQQEILRLFAAIKVHSKNKKRSPHKPLLLLLALGKICQAPNDRLLPYRQIEVELNQLLDRFGKPQKGRQHTQDPFTRLRNDGVWDLPGHENYWLVDANAKEKRPSHRLLHDAEARGGFTPVIHRQLTDDPAFLRQIARLLLSREFPETYHQEVIEAVGLGDVFAVAEERENSPPRSKRDPRFRDKVLNAYKRRCAVCGYSIRMQDTLIGLEAAHILWHAYEGPDEIANGLSLCSIHHRALDGGGISLNDDLSLLVSSQLNGDPESDLHFFQRYKDQPIASPQELRDRPNLEYLAWHRDQVFRS